MRKYRVCPNPKCPSKKDSKEVYSKIGFKTDSKTNPYYCPHCKKRLPDYVPEVNTNADPNIVPNPITPVKKVRNWNLDPIKNFLGGFIMGIRNNWITIVTGLIALILIGFFASISYDTLTNPLTTKGILLLVSIGLMLVGTIIAFVERFRTKPWMKKTKNWFGTIGVIGLIIAILFGSFLPSITPKTNLNNLAVVNQSQTQAQTQPDVFSLGVPANPTDVDPAIWNKPMKDGVMITGKGIVYYTQSGKKGSKLLKGQIPDGQTLVLDSYSLSKKVNDKVESYSGGNLLVIPGPLDLDKNPISYTDGAAQMIGTIGLQKFLDENIWVKFSRGDALKNNSAWSYKPWALTNKWLPDGYHFKKLGLTKKTDTYPNKIPPTIK